jgi:uracil phosphoribosyltransferase
LPARVTVPVEVTPPTTVVGLNTTLVTVASVTFNVAVTEATESDAVIVVDPFAATGRLVTVAVPVVAPAATVTVAGTVAVVVLLEARFTV